MNLLMTVERTTLMQTPEDDAIQLWVTQAVAAANRSVTLITGAFHPYYRYG